MKKTSGIDEPRIISCAFDSWICNTDVNVVLRHNTTVTEQSHLNFMLTDYFTIDNIKHWFDLPNYKFTTNPIDFLGVALLRDCVLLGGAIAAWTSPSGFSEVAAKASNAVFAVMLVILAFAPAKLLAFYEIDTVKLAVGDWILMIWCIFASLAVQYFTIDNIKHWFDLPNYKFTTNPIDFLGVALLRDCVLLGGAIAAWTSPSGFSEVAAKASNAVFAIMLVILAFAPAKLLAFYEIDTVKLAVGDWILMIWCIFASLAVQLHNPLFSKGEICSRLTSDCQTMSNTLSLYMNVLTRNLTMLFGSLIFMTTLSWRLSMITLITVPLIFLVNKVFGVWYDKLSEETQNSVARANDVAEEVLSAIRTVKSFACERFESYRFLAYLNQTLAIATRRVVCVIGLIWTNELLQMGILTIVLWYGGHLVIQGKIESGLLVSFLLYQFQLGENLRELGEVWNGLMQAVGASRKVFEFIDRDPKVKNDGKYAPEKLVGRIEFKNVKFSYPIRPDLPIMEDLTFTVEPGEVVALVGPSGGGKSSCIAMLEHFYEPTGGEVLLDGVPIREYDHKYLHTKVALVGQEPVLYARSVTENIGYGMSTFTSEQVQSSSKLANAHAFIMDTTEGYNTDVGEKGSQMSGGQKQRIAIARALVRDPVVLLLDEATSALDSESEHLVQEAISKNLKGRTVVLIAHRLSTVENADKIVVINHGRVEQMGTHKELINQEGMYKMLVQRQMMSK
ncbi:antigen peptide transporter 2 [Necator americanus]|uniref:Antigen peptide transporter 2 n=1 Tax=Necator americanus TaxID=51031 RepID=W2T3Q6_NECAM|nr:antigen peptide transporter 2 [Necator americanus]ETN76645.1 antigen peptide transporter 2 [Necator americanus]